ncbi:HNH endonuclease [Pseudoxanthomonas sp. SL93]|uniref:HNH endonuclease n=1 Tax=Pseudoxanthomonas sp. SL93 TaxID=2995142 RepID=UPI002271C2F8|nr:HNH endonuclease [Pseudoxanthomonas sp. SL93]WAC62087.1 HNH endonuclease [Pseudoxanthomonas sp. SL93]
MKSSQHLVVGEVYTRAELKAKFDITDASINNGIFKPKGYSSIWLFVTKEKTSDRTQYHDLLDGDTLTMEGQTSGRTDHWLTDHASTRYELLLFYRESKVQYPGAGFVYEGVFEYQGHAGSMPATFTLKRQATQVPPRTTPSRTWELALQAVQDLGGRATPQQVRDLILSRKPDYKVANVQADLAFLSVNSPSRTSYHHNHVPRRTDAGSSYDRLFKVGSGPGVLFELYDPHEHGVWEIYPDASATNSNGMMVRRISDPVAEAVKAISAAEENAGVFDAHSVDDARSRVLAAIVRRRGQRNFREALLKAYSGACAITGCTIPAILEAAHVHPYKGDHTNVVNNGLLLRADIHTLFDLGLIAVESATMTVRVCPGLTETEYAMLDGRQLGEPILDSQRVSASALDWHRSRCGW